MCWETTNETKISITTNRILELESHSEYQNFQNDDGNKEIKSKFYLLTIFLLTELASGLLAAADKSR